MPTITKLTSALEIQEARKQFEANVTTDVYEEYFEAIGQAFKVQSLIGKSSYVYIKCENESKVVGLAYGWPESESIFYIQDIISAPGSHSGSAMVNWFTVRTNVNMAKMTGVALTAAHVSLQAAYAKSHYGFELVSAETGRMTRSIG